MLRGIQKDVVVLSTLCTVAVLRLCEDSVVRVVASSVVIGVVWLVVCCCALFQELVVCAHFESCFVLILLSSFEGFIYISKTKLFIFNYNHFDIIERISFIEI